MKKIYTIYINKIFPSNVRQIRTLYCQCQKNIVRQLSVKSAVEPKDDSSKNKEERPTTKTNGKSDKQKYFKSRIVSGKTGTTTGTDQKLIAFQKPPIQHSVDTDVGKIDNDLSSKKSANLVEDRLKRSVSQEEQVEESEDVQVESLEDVSWKEMRVDPAKLRQQYMKLSKIRLTGLVVVTTMGGYAMAPAAFDPMTFMWCTVGTGLTSAAANAINQYLEVPFDSQMNRTKNRPIVMGSISPLHAVTFAAVTATSGLAMLLLGVNSLTAALGLTNLMLYTMAYTPMKRMSIANTWVGSVVGAIPPMMGWAACTGALEPGAWLLGGILFAWQFPHFNALSWNLRPDYSRAGYRMMSVINPDLCKRTTLRYCAGLIGLCSLAPVLDVTTWAFALESFPLNAYMTYLAYNFSKKGDSSSSRKLFRFSLVHIPALMVLMFINKKRERKVIKDVADKWGLQISKWNFLK